MDLEIIILSGVSQTKKDKYHVRSFNVESNLKMTQKNLQNRNGFEEFKTKLMITKKGNVGGDKLGGWDLQIYSTIDKIGNKDLPYSTGKSTQYCVIACMGNNLKRDGYLYMYN